MAIVNQTKVSEIVKERLSRGKELLVSRERNIAAAQAEDQIVGFTPPKEYSESTEAARLVEFEENEVVRHPSTTKHGTLGRFCNIE